MPEGRRSVSGFSELMVVLLPVAAAAGSRQCAHVTTIIASTRRAAVAAHGRPGSSPMRISRVLIAVDFSETAATAAQWATEHFAPGAHFTLLHVVERPRRRRFAHDALPADDEIALVARQYAERRMHELGSRLTSASVRAELRVGKPFEQVTVAARELRADLVVIGPHGDCPRPSRFLGTTADRIARTSPVPLLIATRPPASAPRRILVPVEDYPIPSALLVWINFPAQWDPKLGIHVT